MKTGNKLFNALLCLYAYAYVMGAIVSPLCGEFVISNKIIFLILNIPLLFSLLLCPFLWIYAMYVFLDTFRQRSLLENIIWFLIANIPGFGGLIYYRVWRKPNSD